MKQLLFIIPVGLAAAAIAYSFGAFSTTNMSEANIGLSYDETDDIIGDFNAIFDMNTYFNRLRYSGGKRTKKHRNHDNKKTRRHSK